MWDYISLHTQDRGLYLDCLQWSTNPNLRNSRDVPTDGIHVSLTSLGTRRNAFPPDICVRVYERNALNILRKVCEISGEPGSSVCIVSGYGLDDWGLIPGRGERIFPLTSVSRPALGPTQPPVQWVSRVLSQGLKRGRGVTLTTHPI
jgi:hypothetical protein